MKPIAEMTPKELAALVCETLARAGVRVTLTGGACAAIWSQGKYESHDLDFIEEGVTAPRAIPAAMSSLDFIRKGRRYVHPDSEFYVEFPSPPLAIGDAPVTRVEELTTETGRLRLLTPTDCVKDRLVAYLHYGDTAALEQAVLVAQTTAADLEEVDRWARAEPLVPDVEAKLRAFRRRLRSQR